MASMAKLASLGGSVSMGIAEVLLERGLITSDHLAAAMELRGYGGEIPSRPRPESRRADGAAIAFAAAMLGLAVGLRFWGAA